MSLLDTHCTSSTIPFQLLGDISKLYLDFSRSLVASLEFMSEETEETV